MRKLRLGLALSFLFCFVTPAFASTYQQYITTIPTPAPITAQTQPVVSELEKEVNRMLIDQNGDGKYDHLAPANFNHGLSAGFGFVYFDTPAELISALSAAYPYLSSGLQTKVKSYLDSEMTLYNPLTESYFPPNSPTIGDQPGIRREPYPIDRTHSLSFWPGPPMSLLVAYPLWQYTNATGDKRFVTNTTNWNALVALYNAQKSAGVKTFPNIVGLTGFSRLAMIKGDTTLANESANLAATALTSLPFATIISNTESKGARFKDTYAGFFEGNSNDGCCTSQFIGVFAPELGAYLHDNSLSGLQSYSARIEKYDPLWYMTLPAWGGDPTGATNTENLYAPPHIGWTNFMIHAYGFAEPTEKLVTYLDFPSRLGDLFYLSELVATIQSKPSGSPGPTVMPSPTPVATVCQKADINQDNFVDISDYSILVANFFKSPLSNTRADINGDGVVDISDYSLLVQNFFKNCP